MEAPERIGTPVVADASATWPRVPLGLAGALVQLWTWPMFVAVTLSVFLAAHLAVLLGVDRRRAFGRGLRLWARGVLFFGACSVEIEGDVRSVHGSVVAANHQGFADILVLAAVLPDSVRFVAREGLYRVPVLGSVLRNGGHLRVPSPGLLRDATGMLSAGDTVVFFPEGTRSRQGRIEALRGGAFRAAARAKRPLVPVVLSGTRHLWGPGTLRLLPARVAVAVLPPRHLDAGEARFEGFRGSLRDEMAAKLRRLEPRTGPRV